MAEDFNVSAEPGNDIHYNPGAGTAETPDGASTFFDGGKGYGNSGTDGRVYIGSKAGTLNLPPKATPRDLEDGDIWSTPQSVYARVSGVTHDLVGGGGGGGEPGPPGPQGSLWDPYRHPCWILRSTRTPGVSNRPDPAGPRKSLLAPASCSDCSIQ